MSDSTVFHGEIKGECVYCENDRLKAEIEAARAASEELTKIYSAFPSWVASEDKPHEIILNIVDKLEVAQAEIAQLEPIAELWKKACMMEKEHDDKAHALMGRPAEFFLSKVRTAVDTKRKEKEGEMRTVTIIIKSCTECPDITGFGCYLDSCGNKEPYRKLQSVKKNIPKWCPRLKESKPWLLKEKAEFWDTLLSLDSEAYPYLDVVISAVKAEKEGKV